jgi:hypothetical protein
MNFNDLPAFEVIVAGIEDVVVKVDVASPFVVKIKKGCDRWLRNDTQEEGMMIRMAAAFEKIVEPTRRELKRPEEDGRPSSLDTL